MYDPEMCYHTRQGPSLPFPYSTESSVLLATQRNCDELLRPLTRLLLQYWRGVSGCVLSERHKATSCSYDIGQRIASLTMHGERANARWQRLNCDRSQVRESRLQFTF